MTIPGRNDPCPCGSGKKYKQCCLAKEEAKRGIAAFPKATKFDSWQVELVPMPARIDDDPAARLVMPFIMADGFLLPSDLLNRPPADPDGAGGIIETALRKAAETTGRLPDTVEIRHPRIARALASRLAESRVKVRCVDELPELREAAKGFVRRSKSGRGDTIAGTVETWSGWGLAPAIVADLFHAAADFYRATPWKYLENDDLIIARFPGGRTWNLCVLGNGGEAYGLDLIEDSDDFEWMHEGGPTGMNDMTGEVIACLFDRKGDNPPRMVSEIRREQWEVAGPAAYPSIIAINTPGCGVSEEHARDFIHAFMGVPGLIDAWQASPAPAVSGLLDVGEFTWRDPETGVAFEMLDFR